MDTSYTEHASSRSADGKDSVVSNTPSQSGSSAPPHSLTDVIKTSERFNAVEPLKVSNHEFIVAEIESDQKNYPKHVGKIWFDNNWFTVAEARELRDWLNKVIPERICGSAAAEGEGREIPPSVAPKGSATGSPAPIASRDPEPWEDGTPTTVDYDNDCAP